MRPSAKVVIVLAGFGVAVAVAWAAVTVRVHLTQGPEAQASSGMYAFGDLRLDPAFVFTAYRRHGRWPAPCALTTEGR